MRPLDPPDGPVAHITGVSGGEVLAAEYAEIDAFADHLSHDGLRLARWSALPTETLVDRDLLATAALAPVSFARVEEALLATLVGPAALPAAAAECEALALAAVGARAAIQVADSGEVAELWTDTRELLSLEGGDLSLPDRAGLALAGGLGLDLAVLGPSRVSLASRLASRLYGAETPTTLGRLPVRVPLSLAQPRSVTDLARHLEELSVLSDPDHPENDGTFEIQTLIGPDGSRRHVVYLPGTDDMDPFSRDRQLRDMQENVRLVADQDTAYGEGILAALRAAGVRPDEPVLLAGHSQGGMEAAALAAHGSAYDVTNVVTFGSPTAQVHGYPSGVHVLSLEHAGDAVPTLDGRSGAHGPEQVTVRFDSGVDGVVANHSFVHYDAGAAAVDASTDPDVVRSVASLGGFFAPGQVVGSQMFQLTRVR